jgi:hypothetical protein
MKCRCQTHASDVQRSSIERGEPGAQVCLHKTRDEENEACVNARHSQATITGSTCCISPARAPKSRRPGRLTNAISGWVGLLRFRLEARSNFVESHHETNAVPRPPAPRKLCSRSFVSLDSRFEANKRQPRAGFCTPLHPVTCGSTSPATEEVPGPQGKADF